jgi:hypothetical protein
MSSKIRRILAAERRRNLTVADRRKVTAALAGI